MAPRFAAPRRYTDRRPSTSCPDDCRANSQNLAGGTAVGTSTCGGTDHGLPSGGSGGAHEVQGAGRWSPRWTHEGDSTFAIRARRSGARHNCSIFAGNLSYSARWLWTGPVGHVQRVKAIITVSMTRFGVDPAGTWMSCLSGRNPPFGPRYSSPPICSSGAKARPACQRPRLVRNAPEKVGVLDFDHFMPPTLVNPFAGRSPRPS